MPLVFHAACDECDYVAPALPAGGFAVYIPDPPDAAPLLGRDHPPVVHPFAPYVLDEFGLTFASAAWGGRLVAVQSLLCSECGRHFERRRLTAGGAALGCGGCLTVAVGGFTVGLAVAFLSGNPFVGAGVGVAVGVAVTAILEIGATAIVRYRYPDRTAAVDTPKECPHCGGRRAMKVKAGGPFPCPGCGARAVRLTPVVR